MVCPVVAFGVSFLCFRSVYPMRLMLIAPFMEPDIARKGKLLDAPEELLQYMDHSDVPEPWHSQITKNLEKHEKKYGGKNVDMSALSEQKPPKECRMQ